MCIRDSYWTSPRKKLSSPERSQSQANLTQPVHLLPTDKLKDRRREDKHNEQKKVTLGTKIKPKVVQCEISKVRPSGDSCTILPRAKELGIAERGVSANPVKNPPTTPVNANVQIFKPVMKPDTTKAVTTSDATELRHVYSTRRDMSSCRLTSSAKVLTKSPIPNQIDPKPRLRLPPRPTYKHSENREIPQRIDKLSDEANKYTPKPYLISSKAINLSYGYKPQVQIKAYKPSACPSYGKYIKIAQPSWESYSSQRDLRSYSSSTPQSNYSRLSAGALNPIKPYGVYNVVSYQGNSNSYCHK
eukprot:TRINITY_DN5444_c0_g5_i4.p1 TRINITY_DN5444_c0_g5~~TRINITY_DN5444_c0_g5_i4.p1  ORF type:complete len:318 (+),score=28.68 TRINITY_DN5444_c0_g5_i4:49-954(+)